jgi:hypothetical protein
MVSVHRLLESGMIKFFSLKQFQQSNSCEHQLTTQGSEDSIEVMDNKVMTLAYQQYGVPMVSFW